MSSQNSVLIQVMQAFSGGLSGAVTRFVTQPFDVLKIRFQMQVEPLRMDAPSKYRGVMHAFSAIYKEEGLTGFWKGHNAGQAMSITYALVQFWSYEQIRVLFAAKSDFFKDRPHLTYFVCGGLAGCLGSIASQPFDLVRTRIVASDPASKSSRFSTARGVYTVYKHQGMYGLFRGLGFTLVQIFPLVGGNFIIYKWLNKVCHLVQVEVSKKDCQERTIPSAMLFINGGLAGTVSKALVYPADFLKKRIQLAGFQHDRSTFGRNPKCPTMFECIQYTLKKEGILGFYKGMAPTLLKSGLTTAVYFWIYDHLNVLVMCPIRKREEQEAAKAGKQR